MTAEINQETALRHIEFLKQMRGLIQDFVSEYDASKREEDWSSVAHCINAVMQVDMSADGAVNWLEQHSGIKPMPQQGFPFPPSIPANVTPPSDNGDDDETHGSYL